jgi:chemotaxis protein methyltransferase CheR
MSAITEGDFTYLAREMRARTGLALPPEKAHLLESRIGPIARREGFISVQELITTARARRDERLVDAMADALTSHDTYFFRDREPYAFFRGVMSLDLAARRPVGHHLRIWCAGCATGQEPYSLAMTLEEMKLEGRYLDSEIVATDFSAPILDKARAALFSQFEVQRGLPIGFLIRHFEKAGDLWRISDRVRARVKFTRHNLLDDASALGEFDIIFCRNVLGGLDPSLHPAVLDRVLDQLADDGYLVLGESETPAGAAAHLAPAGNRAGVFVRNTATRRAA